MKISIIIRTFNEERWISQCLMAISKQSIKNFEVIILDNYSNDTTVKKAKAFNFCKVYKIKNYLPGKALNYAISKSSGQIIVCLSAHCIPTNSKWLKNLIEPLNKKNIFAVYGKQQPLKFTNDVDKRDLINTFGNDIKIQKKDFFFHNANSCFKKKTWKKNNFDNKTYHIEDRIWAKKILNENNFIYYCPEASVFHYHGINQNNLKYRKNKISDIINDLYNIEGVDYSSYENLDDLNIVNIITFRGEDKSFNKDSLFDLAISQISKSKYIGNTYVFVDNLKTYNKITNKNYKCKVLMRPKYLSSKKIPIQKVYKYCLEKIQKKENINFCVFTQINFPYRGYKIVDEMINYFIKNGSTSLIAVKKENKSIWVKKQDRLESISPFVPRKYKNIEFYISLFGLCFICYPHDIINESLGFHDLSPYEINDHKLFYEINE
tara:strand:- start:14765 stop:16069 length:1305 start_codon:yes stop_codon:yes gene_type:complete